MCWVSRASHLVLLFWANPKGKINALLFYPTFPCLVAKLTLFHRIMGHLDLSGYELSAHSLCPFFYWTVTVFNFHWLIHVPYLLSILRLDLFCIPHVFSPSVTCLLTLLKVMFCWTELLHLGAVKLIDLCRNRDFLNQTWGQWYSRWKLAAPWSIARYSIFLCL